MNDHDQVGVVQRRDRHEIAHQPEWLAGDQRFVGRVGVRHHQQRVAVGRRLRDRVGPDDRSGARPVLHHEGLLELLGEMLRDHARIHVGRAAGAERHDQAHLAGRIVLCRGADGRSKPQKRKGNGAQHGHEFLPSKSCPWTAAPGALNLRLVAEKRGRKKMAPARGPVDPLFCSQRRSAARPRARHDRAVRPGLAHTHGLAAAVTDLAFAPVAALVPMAPLRTDPHADARSSDVHALRRELGRLRAQLAGCRRHREQTRRRRDDDQGFPLELLQLFRLDAPPTAHCHICSGGTRETYNLWRFGAWVRRRPVNAPLRAGRASWNSLMHRAAERRLRAAATLNRMSANEHSSDHRVYLGDAIVAELRAARLPLEPRQFEFCSPTRAGATPR